MTVDPFGNVFPCVQFRMGINELRTGDPLQSPDSKQQIDQIYQRIHWELQEKNSDAA